MIRMDVLLVFVYLPSTFLLRDAFADIFVRRPAERNRRFIRGASFKESAIVRLIPFFEEFIDLLDQISYNFGI